MGSTCFSAMAWLRATFTPKRLPPGPNTLVLVLALVLLPHSSALAGAFDQLKSMGGGGGSAPDPGKPQCVSGCGSTGDERETRTDDEGRPNTGIFGLIDHWAERFNAAAEERRAKARAESYQQNQQGVNAYGRGDYAEALKYFKKASVNNPDDKVIAQNLKSAQDQVDRLGREQKLRDEERREREAFRKRMAKVADLMPLAGQPAPAGQAKRLASPAIPLPGFSQAEWQSYLDARDEVDRLYAKLNKDGVLSDADALAFHAALQKRNALWDKAAGGPLTPQQRVLLGLPAYVAVSRTKPPAQAVGKQLAATPGKAFDRRAEASGKAKADEITTVFVADFFSGNIIDLAEEKVQEAVEHAHGEKWAQRFDHLLGAGKITVRAAQEGPGAAGAETADLVLSRIPEPLAAHGQFAVEGGRMYSNVAFRALNRFMEDAMKATGREFHAEEFWKNFDASLNEWQKGVKSWVEFGE